MKDTQPLLGNDFYKQGHKPMYAHGTSLIYSNRTARKSRIPGVNKVVVVGDQYFIKEYLIRWWNEKFFNLPWNEVEQKFLRVINNTLGPNSVDTTHLKQLHDLGYLPLHIKSLPEGALCPIRIPSATITNTVNHAFWLVNYLETIWSCSNWQIATSATLAFEFKKMLNKYALETVGNTDFVQWQGHDFSYRGMSSHESACLSGLGHLLSFTGTDTIPAIEFAEEYYNTDVTKELVGASVRAGEHSVTSLGIMAFIKSPEFNDILQEFIERTPANLPVRNHYDPKLIAEYALIKRLLKEFPDGIMSYVGDTYSLPAVVVEILPRLKNEILNRNGKLVIRPDSFWTDPVDCLCGYDGYHPQMEKLTIEEKAMVKKGLIESLGELFGTTDSPKGYKLLNEHIGAIYGDSINLERAEKISIRLKNKGYASINAVYGIGSFTYQYNTRDTFGFAIKATYGIVNDKPMEIFKDPVTDDGMKKSAKGLLRVDLVNGEYVLKDQCTIAEEMGGELKTVFFNGKLTKDWSLAEVRANLAANL